MTLALIPRIHRATHAIALALASDPELGVTQAEAHVLAHLHETGEARISELHARFGHRRSTLTSVLDRLEQRKLVERRTDPDDRRSFIVAPTRSGRTTAAAVHRVLSAIEREALGGVAAAQRRSAADVLDAIATASERSVTRP
ncbi:MAG TPA: MarR family transcriptional regulator [Candidatus Elarobacter sp.]|nr:MarR family transcriptional regulator [Candidatus Elarobacter sp.]